MYKSPVLNRAEGILEHCAQTLQLYNDYNQYIEEEHSKNKSLFLHKIDIHEPPPRKSNRRGRFDKKREVVMEKPVDPIEIVLEQLNCELKYGGDVIPGAEESEFKRTHTVGFYKKRRNSTKPDMSLDVNKVRYKGKNETSGRMAIIPNTASLTDKNKAKKSALKRKLRIRDNAVKNAQYSVKTKIKPLPSYLKRMSYVAPKREPKEGESIVVWECNQLEKKIKKHEKNIEDNLRSARRICERLSLSIESPPDVSKSARSPRRKRIV